MNKYAEEMEKVALNRLTREIGERPLAFPLKRLRKLMSAGSGGTLDAVSRRQGPDPRRMLRSPETMAVGREYGTRQIIAKMVDGPGAAFEAVRHSGTSLGGEASSYVPGKNSHGRQWNHDEYKALWGRESAEKALESTAPYPENGILAGTMQKPSLSLHRAALRSDSRTTTEFIPVKHGDGVAYASHTKVFVPGEEMYGGAFHRMENDSAARHELFEAQASASNISSASGKHIGDVHRNPSFLGGLGHANASVLTREDALTRKNPWHSILPPYHKDAVVDMVTGSTPISTVRRIAGEDKVVAAARRLKNPTVEALAKETGIPARRLSTDGLSKRDILANKVTRKVQEARRLGNAAADSFLGSPRYRGLSFANDFARQSTYKDSLK